MGRQFKDYYRQKEIRVTKDKPEQHHQLLTRRKDDQLTYKLVLQGQITLLS